MTVYDILAYISYPGTILGFLAVIFIFSASFLRQIKNRFISVSMVIMVVMIGAYFAQMVGNTYSRYFFLSTGLVNPSPTTKLYIVEQFVIFLCLWTLVILYWTQKERIGINLPESRKQKRKRLEAEKNERI